MVDEMKKKMHRLENLIGYEGKFDVTKRESMEDLIAALRSKYKNDVQNSIRLHRLEFFYALVESRRRAKSKGRSAAMHSGDMKEQEGKVKVKAKDIDEWKDLMTLAKIFYVMEHPSSEGLKSKKQIPKKKNTDKFSDMDFIEWRVQQNFRLRDLKEWAQRRSDVRKMRKQYGFERWDESEEETEESRELDELIQLMEKEIQKPIVDPSKVKSQVHKKPTVDTPKVKSEVQKKPSVEISKIKKQVQEKPSVETTKVKSDVRMKNSVDTSKVKYELSTSKAKTEPDVDTSKVESKPGSSQIKSVPDTSKVKSVPKTSKMKSQVQKKPSGDDSRVKSEVQKKPFGENSKMKSQVQVQKKQSVDISKGKKPSVETSKVKSQAQKKPSSCSSKVKGKVKKKPSLDRPFKFTDESMKDCTESYSDDSEGSDIEVLDEDYYRTLLFPDEMESEAAESKEEMQQTQSQEYEEIRETEIEEKTLKCMDAMVESVEEDGVEIVTEKELIQKKQSKDPNFVEETRNSVLQFEGDSDLTSEGSEEEGGDLYTVTEKESTEREQSKDQKFRKETTESVAHSEDDLDDLDLSITSKHFEEKNKHQNRFVHDYKPDKPKTAKTAKSEEIVVSVPEKELPQDQEYEETAEPKVREETPKVRTITGATVDSENENETVAEKETTKKKHSKDSILGEETREYVAQSEDDSDLTFLEDPEEEKENVYNSVYQLLNELLESKEREDVDSVKEEEPIEERQSKKPKFREETMESVSHSKDDFDSEIPSKHFEEKKKHLHRFVHDDKPDKPEIVKMTESEEIVIPVREKRLPQEQEYGETGETNVGENTSKLRKSDLNDLNLTSEDSKKEEGNVYKLLHQLINELSESEEGNDVEEKTSKGRTSVDAIVKTEKEEDDLQTVTGKESIEKKHSKDPYFGEETRESVAQSEEDSNLTYEDSKKEEGNVHKVVHQLINELLGSTEGDDVEGKTPKGRTSVDAIVKKEKEEDGVRTVAGKASIEKKQSKNPNLGEETRESVAQSENNLNLTSEDSKYEEGNVYKVVHQLINELLATEEGDDVKEKTPKGRTNVNAVVESEEEDDDVETVTEKESIKTKQSEELSFRDESAESVAHSKSNLDSKLTSKHFGEKEEPLHRFVHDDEPDKPKIVKATKSKEYIVTVWEIELVQAQECKEIGKTEVVEKAPKGRPSVDVLVESQEVDDVKTMNEKDLIQMKELNDPIFGRKNVSQFQGELTTEDFEANPHRFELANARVEPKIDETIEIREMAVAIGKELTPEQVHSQDNIEIGETEVEEILEVPTEDDLKTVEVIPFSSIDDTVTQSTETEDGKREQK